VTSLTVDRQKLRDDLHRFYDFTNKAVLFVGAGGGQLFDPAVTTKKLIVIDRDEEAVNELKANMAFLKTQVPVEVMASDFADIASSGDVVYFEFCLHEMNSPYGALKHARSLSPDIVVFDHLPGSVWSFYAAEQFKVRRSMEAMRTFGIRRRETFSVEHRFRNHAELHAKVAEQGPLAWERAQVFLGATDIVIPMSYQLALL
jgi:predicted RNA methylase